MGGFGLKWCKEVTSVLKKGLSGNQLKILAMLTMTADHVGLLLFPYVMWLRMVGRLAFPIYAFFIAEGCRHTRSKGKYLLSLLAVAALCQAVELFRGSLYQCVLVTFSLSLGIIWLTELVREKNTPSLWLALGGAVLGSYFVCEILPGLLPGSDFRLDYGFWGVMTPVLVSMGKTKERRLTGLLLGLCCIAAGSARIQWLSLLAVPLLYFYNGQRGKRNIKWLFYFYYPAHLAVIYLIGSLLRS